MRPISTLGPDEAKAIRFVLMDIDDTITTGGKLLAESYGALWRLHDAGLVVVPITGRPAGWCDLIVREWPVDGVVGENGAFAYYLDDGHRRESFHPAATIRNDAAVFSEMRQAVLEGVPESRVSKDQFSRLFDLAIDFAEEAPVLPLSDAGRIKTICEGFGARAKISSIHVNTWFGDFDKLSMAERFLAERFSYRSVEDIRSVMFFGDSPNDEPMFSHFPMSCGVANVRRYEAIMTSLPGFVANGEGALGFAEGVDYLLSVRKA
jgi:HAD superfamily hydrolase (TIGR01484 family)